MSSTIDFALEDVRVRQEITFIQIDSGQRDVNAFPKRNGFKIELSKPITNIESVRIMSLVAPNYHNLGFLPYVIVGLGADLDRIEFGSTNKLGSCIFITTNATFSNGTVATGDVQDGNIVYDDKVAKACPLIFRPYKARLDYLFIELSSPDGQVLDLGSDLVGNVDPLKQFSLTLEIKHKTAFLQ